MSKELMVSKIERGTVIDHIPAGRALAVLRVLGITGREGVRVALVMNVESKKLGRKDIVKIEGRELTPEEVNIISAVAPTATINIVRDYTVVRKFKVSPPEVVKGRFRCKNPTCITNAPREPVEPTFLLVRREPPLFVCTYCGRYHELGDLL
ncbi:aspartate carbamoyltransferase regulatory subunit [Pyrobaculum neutrophilum]|uniref:Aspartate carbamoyltransferase regulatory chain n=1 Tax=Pyrobaculum neutrophilum (strain DSM 2338 / JCM 9278 / NBRC 100436 / V24Sta) TaxID=444157 RepID=PYRI_PYRNV|nr:aspartate carbamoyltransferase regulatory subunit [Pyrobaculum neutrophilum]B1Y9W1.1 RecName: Full=Aspartate carbamoyltransferase regulatory chain [Pyrobaculum neutrophilum V24Sta]ACB40511.1 aspartate carbamoyltransferase, regulatory subunit [Pyrobaculum neutrophilum V24Sta]